jgi:DNA-directed RNA polymerase beta subunit/intein/homing endonuclease
MAKKLIQTSLGWIHTDDRDSYLNKRIELTGTLLNNLFRNYFNKLVKEMQKQVVREINNGSWRSTEDYENIINMTNIYKIMKSTTIENGINRALSTGDFSIKQSNSSKVGVAQVLNRLTYIASLSHLRRINTPLEKSGELIAPRKLHNTTWGFLCLSGDTEVLMSNRSTIKQIKDMKDGDRVNTVNTANLKDEPSDIHSFFSKMPDKLFELTTISGRKIKATANHPFLVNVNGNCQWKNLEDLVANDKIVIRHSIKNMIDTNSTEVCINMLDVLDHYKMELLEANIINTYISTNKLKIIARLIGSLNTDGHLNEIIDGNKLYYSAEFYLGEDSDAFQIADDILELGFGNCSIRRRTTSFDDKNSNRKCIQSTWEVSKGGAFAYLLFLLGGFAGKKTNMKRSIPQWLINAEPSIKREFLSAFQGGDGSRMSYQKNDKNWKPHLGITTQTTYNAYLTDTLSYITQIVDMFGEFGIKSRVKTTKIDDDKTKVCLVFENSSENLVKYADVINYVYCEEKRRTSAPIIEHLKIKEFNKTKRDEQYQYIIDNYGTISTADIVIKTGLTKNQVQKVICKNKKGIRQSTRFTTDIIYESYLKENVLTNGCISVPILNIKEIEPELVYDFTTRSDNHSFVASSFVTHNCPAETPEGQSIGVVKNISYMGHITIPTNSASLYEYIGPSILKVDDTSPEALHGKAKVFINGCWVGVSESPMELYENLKDKKYRGIINIYTSVVFDYKMMELRVCNDGGRLTRPVLKVKGGKALLTKDIVKKIVEKELSWNDLLTNCKIDESVIEYIDPEEQNFAMIAMKAKEDYLIPKGAKMNFTHCEIHPSTIFGILGSCIPYPDHNQAPRNTYQCLDPNEIVHMSDGSKKKIGEVQIGESVITFNPETFEQSHSNVVNQFVRENEHPIYKITTESGREITATGDHKFMTNIGWATVDQMMNDATIKIGINTADYSVNAEAFDEPSIIMTEDYFMNVMRSFEIYETKNRKINKLVQYANSLKSCGLLTLYNNNKLLPTLARIIGFLYADGSLNVYSKNGSGDIKYKNFQCAFDFGSLSDAMQFKDDVSRCGFNVGKILEGSRTFAHKNDNRIQTHHTYTCIYNGAFPAFLVALGISFGKKTENTRGKIPEWIMKSRECSRQFMKGFQGGDGSKISWHRVVDKRNKSGKESYLIRSAETSQQINPIYKESLMVFMEQCVEILERFGVKTTNAICLKPVSENRVKVSFTLSSNSKNLISYFDNIGYAYAQTKNDSSFKVVEYLKYKSSCKTKVCNIKEWLSNKTSVKPGVMFATISTITRCPNGLISDIEVESENHSFISSNGFLSSNCAMAKQAMGVYAMNYDKRMDKTSYVLSYPSRPLVDTRIMNFLHLNKIPSGCQIHVAIMSHTGYNQEDSVLINKGSIDRGLFMTTIYHTEKDEDKNIIRDEIIRCKPDPAKTKGIKFGNYSKLDSQGFIPENSLVANRDVIIAKIVPIKENRNDPTKTVKYEDQSKIFRTTEETYIDKNYTGRNGDGYNFAKVRVRILRKPVLGDKCSSRHGQKGTMGNIIPECDMPFTKDGIRPDIIINPHAIPSRMTIGQLKETLLGKVLLELGLFGDGTSFGNLDVKTIATELQKVGYESYGNEVLYNGLTGEQLESNIFFGPVFYQRLKHMVNDKQHSRAIGPMVNLTRQPAEGRSRDGGFRIGEMERDVMLAHGMSRFCRERLYDASDKYSVHVCKRCGLVASYNDGTQNRMFSKDDFTIHLCKTCNNMTDFARVEIPYSYKLMAQELQAINVVPRLITD